MIAIRLNGERHEVPAGLNVRTLLTHLGVDASRVAVEFNRRIVRKDEWESTAVDRDSEVEVVELVGGGSR